MKREIREVMKTEIAEKVGLTACKVSRFDSLMHIMWFYAQLQLCCSVIATNSN